MPRREIAFTHTLTIYKSKDGWRWKIVASNKETIAVSSEAYSNRKDLVAALDNMLIAINDERVRMPR